MYTKIIPDVSKKFLMPITASFVCKSGSNIYTGKRKSYNRLVLPQCKRYRATTSRNLLENIIISTVLNRFDVMLKK